MNTAVLVIVLFIVGVLVGFFLAKGSSADQKRVQELKNELTNVRKAHQESLEQVNSAIESVKSLAQNMALTYQSLEFTKASLEGREVEKNFLLQIKNGQLERIASGADAKAEEIVDAQVEVTKDKEETENKTQEK
ncbi:hypothetical protein CKF54_03820 [Psittacicella hinzii]|uniref:Uncharacterized protein n=1 Tax=Psittacicella hinzii TaxID=2028575 RepID=A0A3A1Y6U2_9GAMM|nr:DUF1043 family protein [Psittacicella hinzii]RIY32938.1 hypothetical protein CKF54_03820 [Psittacicella hinzii]